MTLAMHATNSIERQHQHFEGVSRRYFESRQGVNHLALKDLMWSYFLRDKAFLRKPDLEVLEPMCGYAEGKEILEKHLLTTVRYEGFDYSETLVETVKKLHPALSVRHIDVTKFVPPRRYDVVMIIGGLHHVPRHAGQVVKNLSEGLESGGVFISYEPTHNAVLTRFVRDRIYRKNTLFDHLTEEAFDLTELNGMFLANGFELVDQIYPGLLSYVLYYNPDAFPQLNVGGPGMVRCLFNLDRLLIRNAVGRKLSFATLSMWRKK